MSNSKGETPHATTGDLWGKGYLVVINLWDYVSHVKMMTRHPGLLAELEITCGGKYSRGSWFVGIVTIHVYLSLRAGSRPGTVLGPFLKSFFFWFEKYISVNTHSKDSISKFSCV